MSQVQKAGSVVCVSTGMTLGAHMSPICRSHIEQADVVFAACHPMLELWLKEMNSDVRSLQVFTLKEKTDVLLTVKWSRP
jgi:hypothetical protein